MSPTGPSTLAATFRGEKGMEAFVPAVGTALVAQRIRVAAPAHFAARLTTLPASSGASLVRVAVPALSAERRAADASGSGSLFLMYPERARGVMEHEGGRVEIRPGICLIIPSSAAFVVAYDSPAVLTFCELPPSVAGRRYGLEDGPVSAVEVHPVTKELLRSVAVVEAAALRQLSGSGAPHEDVVHLTSVMVDALVNGRSAPDRASVRTTALRIVETSVVDPDLDVAAVARRMAVSVRTLHRAFEGGPTLHQEITRLRLDRAARMLASHPDRSLADVAHACGFGSHSRFSAQFRERFGATPSAWRDSIIAMAESS